METITKVIIYGLAGVAGAYFYTKVRLAGCRTRTCLDFVSSKEIWSDVEAWAKEEGYKLKSQSGMERVYRKGSTAYLLIRQDDDKIHIEAWVDLGFKQEVAADYILSKSFRNRHVVRINKLLVMLGCPFVLKDLIDTVDT